jgi:hypothetical protein
MGNDTHIPADAKAMNALAKAIGAVVFATVRRLPATEREAFAEDLAAMAQERSDAGDTIGEMLLIDLHAAATAAGRTAG